MAFWKIFGFVFVFLSFGFVSGAQVNESDVDFSPIEISQGITYRKYVAGWGLDCYNKPHNEFTIKSNSKPEKFCETKNLDDPIRSQSSTGWRISVSSQGVRKFEEIGYRKSAYRCSVPYGRLSIDGVLQNGIYFEPKEYYDLIIRGQTFGVELGYPKWPSCSGRSLKRYNSIGLKDVIESGFLHLASSSTP